MVGLVEIEVFAEEKKCFLHFGVYQMLDDALDETNVT